MNYTDAVIHALFECEDCDWKTGDYIRGETEAGAHAVKFKHRVRGETASLVIIDGRKD